MRFRRSLRVARWTAAFFGLLVLATSLLTIFGRVGMKWLIPAMYASYSAAFIIPVFDTRSVGLSATDLACGSAGFTLMVALVNAALGGIIGFVIGTQVYHDNTVA